MEDKITPRVLNPCPPETNPVEIPLDQRVPYIGGGEVWNAWIIRPLTLIGFILTKANPAN